MRDAVVWQISEPPESVPDWFAALKLNPLVYRVLAARGLTEEAQTMRFLYPTFEQQHDPLSMLGMSAAVERLRGAISRGEKILIHGDYDADGLTATAVLYRACRLAGAPAERLLTFVPEREDGYGVGEKALALALAEGVRLLITVDCGITADREVAALARHGIDVIITDHHEPGEKLPPALAVVNPRQPGCSYPFKDLAGVGIAYKLALALLGPGAKLFLPLVAIGTVADIVPLRDENRLYLQEGLKRLNADRGLFAGLQALIDVSGLAVDKKGERKEINAGNIGFVLAPRLNAAGRLDNAADPLALLLSDDGEECREIALRLDEMNRRRQQEEAKMVEEAVAAVDEVPRGLVLYRPHWPHGVVGIGASRLVERFYRPTVLLGRDDEGLLRGSGRSIAGFDLVAALRVCLDRGHLLRAGGHKMAAGVALTEDMLPGFVRAFDALAAELPAETFRRELRVDAAIDAEDLTTESLVDLGLLAPHGMGNPAPTFVLQNLTLAEVRTVGMEGSHLRLTARDGRGKMHSAIMFGGGHRSGEPVPGALIDFAFRPALEEYNGREQISLRLQDFRLPDSLHFLPVHQFPGSGSGYESQWHLVYNEECIRRALAPDRDRLAVFYRQLRTRQGRLRLSSFAAESELPLQAAYSAAAAGFQILAELGLLTYRFAGSEVAFDLLPPPEQKRDVSDSPTYRALEAWLLAYEEE